ncbi:MAG: hypothetical protein H7Y60_09130 [Rhodospirillaceae bacterium]|nr:hypothetical protein [Rhodospirillales bacterium]
MAISPEAEAELRKIALDSYRKLRIGRPHIPHPDTPEGQQKLDRLFGIISAPFRDTSAMPPAQKGSNR